MKVGFAIAFALLDAPVAWGDIRLHSYEGANSRLVGFLLELPGSVQVAVIGYCECGLLEFQCPLDQVVNAVGAVEEGVFRMTVKMNE